MNLGLLWVALLGCGSTVAPSEPVKTRPHVLLVTLDTVRADRIGAYGDLDAKTPRINALAKGGLRFDRAYSPAPLTIPAHAAIFSGMHPAVLGIRGNGHGTLEAETTTLTEVLRQEGYVTGGVVGAFVTGAEWGFNQGFDWFDDELGGGGTDFWHAERRGDKVVDGALRFLEWTRRKESVAGKPVFLWVHLFDAHAPYAPPEKYAKGADPYQGEIDYLDSQVGRLLDAFAGEDVVVVVVGDHGESLGKRTELTHGLFVYDDTQRVPFIVHGPGLEPRVVSEPVSLMDVAPTILGELGIAGPPEMTGRAVPSPESPPIYLESLQLSQRFGFMPHRGLIDHQWKWIDLPQPELYDLVADPGETKNLATDRPEDARRMADLFKSHAVELPVSIDSASVDSARVAELRALGYMDQGLTASKDSPDPKEKREFLARVYEAEVAIAASDVGRAKTLLEELIAERPDLIEVRIRLANVLAASGDAEGSAAQFEAARALAPDDGSIVCMHAHEMHRLKRYEDAVSGFLRCAELQPFAPRPRALAFDSRMALGDVEGAIALGLDLFKRFPNDPFLAGKLAPVLVRAGKFSEAGPVLQAALKTDRPERDIYYFLATSEQKRGRLSAAETYLGKELQNYPQNRNAARAWVRLRAGAKDTAGVVQLCDELIAMFPDDVVILHSRAQALFTLGRLVEARVALDAALGKHPDNPDLLLLDANLLKEEGKLEAANLRFEAAKAAKQSQLGQSSEKDRTDGAP